MSDADEVVKLRARMDSLTDQMRQQVAENARLMKRLVTCREESETRRAARHHEVLCLVLKEAAK